MVIQFIVSLLLLLSITAQATPYSMEHIEGLIKRHNIKSVDGLLEKMPTPLFENYALMYFSQSLQEASFMNPRAIVFNDDASFVFTFNGHKEQRGYNTLEVMEFDFSKDKFEFHEVDFSSGKAKISYNDAKCLNCHRQDPRPNWEHYPIWPGAYGSFDDVFDHRKDSRYSKEFDVESEKLHEFLNIKSKHSRYKSLSELLKPYKEFEFFTHRPLALFTEKIYELNARRIVRLMKKNHYESFNSFRYLFLGSIIGCSEFNFFPEQSIVKYHHWINTLYESLVHPNNSPAFNFEQQRLALFFDTDTESTYDQQDKKAEIEYPFTFFKDLNSKVALALIMYLSHGEYETWHTNFHISNLRSRTRGSDFQSLVQPFAKSFMGTWRDWPISFLKKPVEHVSTNNKNFHKACEYLSKKSIKQLKNVNINKLVNEADSLQ